MAELPRRYLVNDGGNARLTENSRRQGKEIAIQFFHVGLRGRCAGTALYPKIAQRFNSGWKPPIRAFPGIPAAPRRFPFATPIARRTHSPIALLRSMCFLDEAQRENRR